MIYDLDYEEFIFMLNNLIGDGDTLPALEEYDQELLQEINEACGCYNLKNLTPGEITMWLRGIRDGIELFT